MRVVCIDNTWGNSRHFEIGKTYDVVNTILDKYYVIKNCPLDWHREVPKRLNEEQDIWAPSECFLTLEEWRSRQLNKLI